MQKNDSTRKAARKTVRKTAKSNLDKDVGVRIRSLRKTLGLSVDRLAEILDITSSHVRLIEYGQRGVTLSLCQKLCDTFNLTADYVIYGEASQKAGTKAVKKDHTELSKLAADSLDESERKCFAELIREYTFTRNSPVDAELLTDAMRNQLKTYFKLKTAIRDSEQ